MVAVKNKVNMFLWKHLASSTSLPTTPLLSFNPVDGFVKHRVSVYCILICLSVLYLTILLSLGIVIEWYTYAYDVS